MSADDLAPVAVLVVLFIVLFGVDWWVRNRD